MLIARSQTACPSLTSPAGPKWVYWAGGKLGAHDRPIGSDAKAAVERGPAAARFRRAGARGRSVPLRAPDQPNDAEDDAGESQDPESNPAPLRAARVRRLLARGGCTGRSRRAGRTTATAEVCVTVVVSVCETVTVSAGSTLSIVSPGTVSVSVSAGRVTVAGPSAAASAGAVLVSVTEIAFRLAALPPSATSKTEASSPSSPRIAARDTCAEMRMDLARPPRTGLSPTTRAYNTEVSRATPRRRRGAAALRSNAPRAMCVNAAGSVYGQIDGDGDPDPRVGRIRAAALRRDVLAVVLVVRRGARRRADLELEDPRGPPASRSRASPSRC